MAWLGLTWLDLAWSGLTLRQRRSTTTWLGLLVCGWVCLFSFCECKFVSITFVRSPRKSEREQILDTMWHIPHCHNEKKRRKRHKKKGQVERQVEQGWRLLQWCGRERAGRAWCHTLELCGFCWLETFPCGKFLALLQQRGLWARTDSRHHVAYPPLS